MLKVRGPVTLRIGEEQQDQWLGVFPDVDHRISRFQQWLFIGGPGTWGLPPPTVKGYKLLVEKNNTSLEERKNLTDADLERLKKKKKQLMVPLGTTYEELWDSPAPAWGWSGDPDHTRVLIYVNESFRDCTLLPLFQRPLIRINETKEEKVCPDCKKEEAKKKDNGAVGAAGYVLVA